MNYPNVASGLRLLFIAQILSIVGALALWLPLVGALLVIAGVVLELVGIYKAGADDENYRGALVFAAALLAVNVIGGFVPEGILSGLLEVVSEVLGLLVVFSVCNTTANLLHSVGNEALSQRGSTVIKIYAVCTVISIVCTVLGVVPIVRIAAGLVSLVAAIFQVAGYVMYLLFLYDSSRVL